MEKLLEDASRQINVYLNDNQIKQFFEYKNLLLEWNKKINLTTITDHREIVLKHFLDSIVINSFIGDKLNGKNVIDVGTGAGFPGIPIKIANPSINLTLLDSLNKRVKFLQEVINNLELNNVDCVHSRAEDGGQNLNYREKFDYCVSRAVARLSVLSEFCLPFVKIGGSFVALKGPNVFDEVEEAKNAVKVLGGEIKVCQEVNVPFIDLKHTLVVIEKVKKINRIYPRKSGIVVKNPL